MLKTHDGQDLQLRFSIRYRLRVQERSSEPETGGRLSYIYQTSFHSYTYSDFFGHISSRFMDCDFQALTLGSDDELAMWKCMMHFFPRATTIVCSRHLRENTNQKLDDMVGKQSDLCRRLMDALFGTSGLVSLDNVVSFDAAVAKLRAPGALLSTAPQDFIQYFDRRFATQQLLIYFGFTIVYSIKSSIFISSLMHFKHRKFVIFSNFKPQLNHH